MATKALQPQFPLVVKFLAIGVVIVTTLCLIEILVRIFSPHPHYEYNLVPDEKMGWKYRAYFRGRATNIFGEFDTRIEINKGGFRDRDRSLTKDPNTFRIAFIGDSFTAAEQVEEPQCFVRRTETLLNEKLKNGAHKPSLHVECINFGIGGFDFQQYVLCYENYIRNYKPDLVVMMSFVHNDIIGNVFYLAENNSGRPYFRLVDGKLEQVPANIPLLQSNYNQISQRLKVHWYHHLQLYNAQKQIGWAIRQRLRYQKRKDEKVPLEVLWNQAGNSLFRYYAFDGKDPVVKEADDISRLLLKKLESEIYEDGTHLQIAMLPAKENLFPEKWSEELKDLPGLETIPMDFNRPFEKIKEFLPEMSSRNQILDLRPALRKASEVKPVFFPQDSHFNQWGHEVTAEALASWLEPLIK